MGTEGEASQANGFLANEVDIPEGSDDMANQLALVQEQLDSERVRSNAYYEEIRMLKARGATLTA